MNITILLRIALVGIIVTMLNQILGTSKRDEIGFIITLSGWILVILWIIPYIVQFFNEIQKLFTL